MGGRARGAAGGVDQGVLAAGEADQHGVTFADGEGDEAQGTRRYLDAGGPQGATQGEPVMDMNQYLIDKVMEIKQRMGAGGAGVGALGAMMQQQQPQPQPQPQPQQQQQVEMV